MKIRVSGSREVQANGRTRCVVLAHELDADGKATGDTLSFWFTPEVGNRLTPGTTIDGEIAAGEREPRLRRPTEDEQASGCPPTSLSPC